MNEEQSLLITYELDGLLVLLSPIVAAFIISAIAGFGTVFGAQSRTPRKLAEHVCEEQSETYSRFEHSRLSTR